MSSPYAAEVPALIRDAHEQIVRAYATHPEFAAPIALDLEADGAALTVTLRERETPRVTLNATAAVVGSPSDVLEQLDARTGVRLSVELGYVLRDGTEDVVELFDLGLRSATRHRPGDLIDLTASSDEALVIDGSPAVAATATGATTAAAIVDLLADVIAPAPTVTIDPAVAGPAVTVDPVIDRWATVADLADRVGARVFDEGRRAWRIAATPALAAPVLELAVGEGGTILEDSDGIDRDEWFNYVILQYKWRDATDVDHVVEASAYVSDGPYRITGPAGKRIMLDTRTVPTTQAEANAAAIAVLKRALSRSRRLTLTAVAAWWVAPGDTVRVTLEVGSTPVDCLAEVVELHADGTMTLDLVRVTDLVGITLATTTPPASAPTPDPAPAAAGTTTYTSTWAATSWATYKGSGSKRTDLGTEVAQGYYDGTNGNQQAVILFAGTAIAGEVGKSIGGAITASTTLAKATLSITATHSYSSAGATGRVGYYPGTAIPASYSGARPYVSSTSWRKGTTRTLNLSSSALFAALKDGTCRGVTFGPGVGSDRGYYLKLDPSTARLTLTYSR